MPSATRAKKNLKKILSLVPDALPAVEPLEGYYSLVPFDILKRWHRMAEHDLQGYPKLQQAARLLQQENPPDTTGIAPHGIIFPDPLFKGTIYLAQITFQVTDKVSYTIDDASLSTISQYLTLALPAISKYCTLYGSNSLQLSSQILKLAVPTPQLSYSDDTLQGWLQTLFKTIDKRQGQTCIVVFNIAGIHNATLDAGDGGYHDAILVREPSGFQEIFTYCVTEINPVGLTVDDHKFAYVNNLTHEIAEMTVDPFVSHTNPEVCDPCASNCHKQWFSFFANGPNGEFNYLGSFNGTPPDGFTWDFFIAAICQPPYTSQCPSPDLGCNYAPAVTAGRGELFFYERSDGYAEFYSVDPQGNIAIQTIYHDLRTTWSLIVPGPYTFKQPPSRNDLLFYSESPGRGEFYKTGLLGDTSQLSVHTNWRTTWSMIVPGSFSVAGAKDLLFYEPSDGFGEFDHTDGSGNLTLIGTQNSWRKTWSTILPGRFSNGPLTGLLFYSASEGTGQFYATLGKGTISLLGTHTDWRKTWTIIVPGHFSNNFYTDLLFYSPSEGTGEFYSTDGRGGMTLLKTQTGFRGTWTAIVTGDFSNSPYDDLLFYSASEGVGEFYSTDGHGNISLIKSHTDWRKTWSIILSL